MGEFDHLFSPAALPTEKCARMLEADLYWQIIENSLDDAETLDNQEENLIRELLALTAEDIIGFKLRTTYYLFETYTSEMWCAASIMNEGSSDDGFHCFRNWLMSQGKDFFYTAVNSPDDLANYFEEGFNENDLYEFENFYFVADQAFLEKFKVDLHDYMAYDHFPYFEENYPDIELTWDEDNLTSQQVICPRLFKIFIEDYHPDDHDDDDDDDDDDSDWFDFDEESSN